MARLAILCAALFCVASAVEVSPVEKVIELLEDLKSEVETEGQNEAATYDTFSCFCKSTTEEKASAIKTEQDNIEGFAASMQEQTEISNAKGHEIKELDSMISQLDKEMEGVVARREKEKTRYESQAADLSKGISSLEGAVADMQAGMPSSLASIKTVVRKSVIVAEALNISPKAQHALAALLQQEPEDNTGSSDIVSTLESLGKDFKGRKSQLDLIEGQNSKDFDAVMKTKTAEKKTANGAKSTAEGEKDTAEEKIAEDSDSMVLEEATLKDDELYMKDLTEKCEQKAREWDQRSQMRADEVSALTKALNIIKNKVKDNSHDTRLVQKAAAAPSAMPQAEDEEFDMGGADFSLLQEVESPRKKLRLIAAKVSSATSMEARQTKVIQDLAMAGKALNSPILTSIAARVGADPFAKVKKLVQNLIERLVEEAAEEATKKGWCDTEMGKATLTRNQNMNKVMSLNAELQGNQALKAELTEEIATLTEEVSTLNDSLSKQTKLRTQEKAENMESLDKAKEGLAAVKDARNVLVEFYKKGAKAAASLLQASPVDADAPASSSGSYKGGQQKAGGIVAMLEVIISDFQRSIKVTTNTEKDAHRAFIEFERVTKTSITEKETGKNQAELDAKSTEQKVVEGMDDMDQHQKMLDDNLKTLEDLKPACVDTGMSYADRVAKREEEIAALKKAMCELDSEKVESQCQ